MSSSYKKAKIFDYADFDVSALCGLATRLRRGRSCDCDRFQNPLAGSLNWAITLSFNDGVEWIFRSPWEGAVSCQKSRSSLLASEAATLKYLKANSTIPVPEVFAYRFDSPSLAAHQLLLTTKSSTQDNEIGVPYILMSKASGFPLNCKWHSMSSKDKGKILQQLGQFSWQLSTLRFDKIGSLFETNGNVEVRTCLCRGLVTYDRQLLDNIDHGPFPNSEAYFGTLISALSEHAQCLRLNPHCFFAPIPLQEEYADFSQYKDACDKWNDFVILGDKIDCSPNRLDYVIVADLLSEVVSNWLKDTSSSCTSPWPTCQFPLHHPDLSVNNIFIDDQYQITCVIDWGFSSTVPLPVLLAAPGLPQMRNRLDKALASAFEDGFRLAALKAYHDENLQDYQYVCEMLQHSRPIWSLSRLLDFSSIEDFNLFQELWRSIGLKDITFSDAFRKKQTESHYRQLYEETTEEDPSPERVSRYEEQLFNYRGQLNLTIARKLTLISDWRSRYDKSSTAQIRGSSDIFVADRRLWQWISLCLEDLNRNTQ